MLTAHGQVVHASTMTPVPAGIWLVSCAVPGICQMAMYASPENCACTCGVYCKGSQRKLTQQVLVQHVEKRCNKGLVGIHAILDVS